MEDNKNNEFGYVRIECLQSGFGKLFHVYGSHLSEPRKELPFKFDWNTNSLDILHSLLAVLGITHFCSKYGPPDFPSGPSCTEYTNCTIDGIIEWLTKNDSRLDLIAENTAEEDFETRLKQWQDLNPAYTEIAIRVEA